MGINGNALDRLSLPNSLVKAIKKIIKQKLRVIQFYVFIIYCMIRGKNKSI